MDNLIVLIGIVIFITSSLILNVNTLSTTHKRRMLHIKFLGDSSHLHYRAGNKKLLVYKYFLEKVKPVKNHKNKIETLFKKNHILIDVSDYMVYKMFSVAFISIFFTGAMYLFRQNSIFATIYMNSNLVVGYLIGLFMLIKFDEIILKLVYESKVNRVKEEIVFFSTLFQMCVEAGDNLYVSLYEATKEAKGILKYEFNIVLSEYDSGVPLNTSLSSLEERLPIDELSNFISFIKRAYASKFDDFATFISNQRTSLASWEMNAAKEYEKVIKDKLTLYNSLTFTAILINLVIPILYMLIAEMNF